MELWEDQRNCQQRPFVESHGDHGSCRNSGDYSGMKNRFPLIGEETDGRRILKRLIRGRSFAWTISAMSFTHRETPGQLLDQCRCHRTGKNDKITRGYITPTVKDTKDMRDKIDHRKNYVTVEQELFGPVE